MTIATILAATDFSPASIAALRVAAAWARKLEARVALMHAFNAFPIGVNAATPDVRLPAEELGRAATERLEGLAAEHFEGVATEVHAIEHASAWLAVCDFALTSNAGLIVLGTHGHTHMERLLIGSVAERVARHAPCPVLAVRGSLLEQPLPERILLATDFSEEAGAAIEVVGEIAPRFGSSVTVGHVYDSRPPLFGRDSGTKPANIDADLRGRLEAVMKERLPKVEKVDLALMSAPCPVIGLCDQARATKVDLIAMATHGQSGAGRVVMGNVVERTLRHAPCSVMTVRSKTAPNEP